MCKIILLRLFLLDLRYYQIVSGSLAKPDLSPKKNKNLSNAIRKKSAVTQDPMDYDPSRAKV